MQVDGDWAVGTRGGVSRRWSVYIVGDHRGRHSNYGTLARFTWRRRLGELTKRHRLKSGCDWHDGVMESETWNWSFAGGLAWASAGSMAAVRELLTPSGSHSRYPTLSDAGLLTFISRCHFYRIAWRTSMRDCGMG